MITRYRIMRPGELHVTGEVDWPEQPGYAAIKGLVEPILGGRLEHVTVLNDFDGSANERRGDMFVDEHSAIDLATRMPRNEAATAIYRRATLHREPHTAPETLPAIYGPAILFSRRIWW